jgi:hypothetical protein
MVLSNGGNELDLRGGRIIARGALAEALSQQLASAPQPGAPIAVRMSFVDRAGRFCRAFELDGQAGLACRSGEQWTVQALVEAGQTGGGTMRQAASALPASLLSEIDSRIRGDPLNAADEQKARTQGWKR